MEYPLQAVTIVRKVNLLPHWDLSPAQFVPEENINPTWDLLLVIIVCLVSTLPMTLVTPPYMMQSQIVLHVLLESMLNSLEV